MNSEYVPTKCSVFEGIENWRKQEWISVDERLPEEFGVYMCYGYCAYGVPRRIDIAQFYGKWQTYDDFTVTHWMPLPEAPKMKGGAE